MRHDDALEALHRATLLGRQKIFQEYCQRHGVGIEEFQDEYEVDIQVLPTEIHDGRFVVRERITITKRINDGTYR